MPVMQSLLAAWVESQFLTFSFSRYIQKYSKDPTPVVTVLASKLFDSCKGLA